MEINFAALDRVTNSNCHLLRSPI